MKTYIRMAAAVLAVMMLFVLCSCSSGLFAQKCVAVNVVNEIPDKLRVLSVSFYLASEEDPLWCPESGVYLEAKTYTFLLSEEDVKNEEDLKTLSAVISVYDENYIQTDVATFLIPSEYGDSYTYILRLENGEYAVTEE